MNGATALQLLHNLTLLLVLTIPHRAILRATVRRPMYGAVLKGLLFGAVSIVGMSMPLVFSEGLIFDSRSVITSVGSLFGGPVTGLIAFLLAGGFRLLEGGVGTLPGVGLLGTSVALGVAFHGLRRRFPGIVGGWPLWGFGVLVHLVMLLWLTALPSPYVSPVLSQIALPVMIVFPLGCVVLGSLLAADERELERDRLLKDSEQRFRGVFESGPLAMVMVDLNLRISMVNDAACNLFNMPREQLIGKSPMELSHPDDREVSADEIRSLQTQEKPLIQLVKRYLNHEGETLWARTTVFPVADASGATAYTFAILENMTERRVAEQALRASEARFRTLTQSLPSGVFVTDAAGSNIYWNDKLYAVTGLSGEDPMGAGWAQGIHPDDRERVKDEWRATVEDGEPFHTEMRLQRPDGHTVHTVAQAVPITGEHGEVTGYVGSVTDVTHLKRVEEELARHRDDLDKLVRERTAALETAHKQLLDRERLATLGRLTATVSHELRNPLGTIRTSFFSIAESVRAAGLKLDDQLDRIERNIVRCDRIIEELLDHTRTRPPDRQPTRADAWLNQVLDELKPPPGVHIERRLAADVLVPIDRERMRRAVVNVFTNACQAMSEAEGAQHRLLVESVAADESVFIRFTDSGGGIPADRLEKAFEPLYSSKGFGVGLGLTVVRQTLEAHGGAATLHSAVGAGTTVTFQLPYSTTGQGPAQGAPR